MIRRSQLAAICAAAVTAIALSTAPAHAETGMILTVPEPIADSYIVVLQDAAPDTAATLAERYNATVTNTYRSALTGFSATMSEADARRLAADPAVAYVEEDGVVRVAATQTNPPSWGLDRIDQRQGPMDNAYTYPNAGGDAEIFIIDTGIRITHDDFGGRAIWGVNTVDSNNTDCNGHGTHVAGIAGGTDHGVAKEAQLIAVKVIDCNGSGSHAGVIAGVDWVTANGGANAVANMSLNGTFSQALHDAVLASVAAGITYTLASGNDYGNACNFTPAGTGIEPGAITVGPTDTSDAIAPYANYGPCVDLYAPGVNIISTWNTGDQATQVLGGSSTAAPHAAGAAAILLTDDPSLSPAMVEAALLSDATTISNYLLLYID